MKAAKRAISTLLVMFCSGCALAPPTEPTTVPLKFVIDQIEQTLDAVGSQSARPFTAAEITLETMSKDTGSGTFNIVVVSTEASHSESTSQTIYFKLTRKTDKAVVPPAIPRFSQELAKTIISASRDIDQALKENTRLELDGMSATIKFTIEQSVSGGAEFEFAPIKIGGKRSKARSAAHSIKLLF